MKVIGLAFAVMLIAILVLLSVAAYAVEAAAPAAGEYGILAGAFLGFASLIVTVKLIAGIIRFASIIKDEGVKLTRIAITITGRNSA
ncbi:MAG: hypothetical protein ED859_08200 [Desulfuromonadales bacterium]|nr:MAG: hypothetical protein ED859_08200 [Desulfuromonadales bacterium]